MATRLIQNCRAPNPLETPGSIGASPVRNQPEAQARESKPPSAAVILGIDPGLDRTGYAVVEMPRGVVVDAGLVRSDVRAELPIRLSEIAAGLDEVLSECRPDLIAVEELFAHYKHPRTAILMGHVRGVVLLAAAQRGVEVMHLPATRIKKTLTGNGHAAKAQMQRAIMTTLQLPRMPQPADVADALAIAWCAGMTTTRAPLDMLRQGKAARKWSGRR